MLEQHIYLPGKMFLDFENCLVCFKESIYNIINYPYKIGQSMGSCWKHILWTEYGAIGMARIIGIGIQSFEKLITENSFYIDKTDFIRQWWENRDDVTLITRPRRFGKTLNMNMLERFLSLEYAGQGEIFEGLSIWKVEKYRNLQGTWPVLFLSFADIKEL